MSDDLSPWTGTDAQVDMHAAAVDSLFDLEEAPATQAEFAGRDPLGVHEVTVEEELLLLKQENAKLRDEIQSLHAVTVVQ